VVGDEVGGKVGDKDIGEVGRNDDGNTAADIKVKSQMKG
jgi:hypothetical protein